MDLKELIIFIVVVLNRKRTMGSNDQISIKLLTDENETTSHKMLDTEAIQHWTDVGVGLSKITVSTDSTAIIEALTGLSGAISYLGPFLAGLLNMVPGSNEFEGIKEQLNKMDSHLFAIENKIDALAKLVTHTNIISYYKLQAEKINLMEMAYKRYINKGTNINMNELIDNCNRNNVLNYVYYVHSELRDSSILSLMTVMKDDYNLANFQLWMKMLVGSVSQCMMLHTICMFAKYKHEPDLNDTMDGDLVFFKDISDVMVHVVENGTNDIKENFFGQAKKEIRAYASAHRYRTSDHTEFVRDVWSMLVKKYFWRYWFVASYDDELYGEDNHYVAFFSTYIYAWFREHNRNINVAHTNNNDSNIADRLKEILNGRKWNINSNARCKYIYEYVNNRIGGMNSLGWLAQRVHFLQSGQRELRRPNL